jgi:hypothetical protein
MKVILNKCYGGFDVSSEGYKLYAKKKGLNLFFYKTSNLNYRFLEKISCSHNSILNYCFTKDFGLNICKDDMTHEDWDTLLNLDTSHRTDPILIEVVEELGKEASGTFGNLQIVEIPDDMEYEIEDYDGVETLHELHRSW